MAIKAVWPTDSGVIDNSIVNARKMYVVNGELPPNGVIIYWTNDGTVSGGSLASTSDFPFVQVLIAEDRSGDRISGMGFFGPMIATGKDGDKDTYFWRTTWDATNSNYLTTIYLRGEPSLSQSSGASYGRQYFAYMISR